PPIWQSVAGYGHIEQPIEIWLVLVAVRYIQTEKMMPAGIAFGLAVLSRSSALLLSIPLGLAALRAGPVRTIRLFAGTAAIGLAVLVPFAVSDSSDLMHSL